MDVILVLEDDAANQAVFSTILRREGYQVLTAENAQQAFAACRQQRGGIDLLIADLQLPDLPGTEAALRIRESYPHIPILFTSGTPIDCWSDSELREISRLPDGAYSFLPKPFTCWTLAKMVSRMLARVSFAHSA